MRAQQPNGIHHVAIMSANMKEQLTFFTQVMGFPLVGLFEMHGVPGGKHAFLKMDEDSFFSVVELAGIGEIPPTLGITHAGTGAGKCAAGTMQHLAFRVSDEAGLIAMRDRIRSHGVPAIGPIGHGFCKSIYFAGPEGLTLEVSYAVSEVDPARWVDPKMLAECGIAGAE
ncbi:MAG TPA: VOC family protein, partial [Novosphingobium sp.]|nr:VOC family protein [Novosphingobium sp.]